MGSEVCLELLVISDKMGEMERISTCNRKIKNSVRKNETSRGGTQGRSKGCKRDAKEVINLRRKKKKKKESKKERKKKKKRKK